MPGMETSRPPDAIAIPLTKTVIASRGSDRFLLRPQSADDAAGLRNQVSRKDAKTQRNAASHRTDQPFSPPKHLAVGFQKVARRSAMTFRSDERHACKLCVLASLREPWFRSPYRSY